ncbi:MAG: transcription antitermination factor NusB [Thiohalomonadales bacterium]
MSNAKHNARRCAVQALYVWLLNDGNLSDIEQQVLEEQDAKKIDKKYFRELLHKVPKTMAACDAAIEGLIDRKVNEVDPIEKAVLAIAHYELTQRLDIPYRVVINESIELAKVFGAEQSHKFINGVVDKLARIERKVELNAARQRK